MLEEIEDFRLERSIRSLKTNEEIEKLSVDEKLSSLDRALYLLKNGQDVQKLSVVSNLTSLMRQSPSDTQRKVLPKIWELVFSAHVDIQVGREQTADGVSIPFDALSYCVEWIGEQRERGESSLQRGSRLGCCEQLQF
ncbi:serine/threonine-protein phosphatase 4 regulatory subunit 4-like isoform X2 [Corticium candelabrum]|uniref:serine/threonine-protein phosphatase 4 regulatory subunit 4-like isoform X2 n=1 Tax=Corticium candelabrum TaxID=121492 RepID=UPI002E268B30|nr:serine/threonine-protein phosphatase 4 regulatory subunit 4-like isoform X2 [Corticium candelabrum]